MKGQRLRDNWSLDPSITFLNHGSFGACPIAVLEAQAALRAQLEREPVRFFVRELPALLERARQALAAFVGAEADDVAFVTNATTGVNTVLRSLDLAEGDELLATDHTYNACRNALEAVAAGAGARVVVAALPFPGATPERALEAVLGVLRPEGILTIVCYPGHEGGYEEGTAVMAWGEKHGAEVFRREDTLRPAPFLVVVRV